MQFADEDAEREETGVEKDSAHLVNRYSRQMLIPGFGMQGQQSLASSNVLVVGCGGIGSSLIMYLAGAGVNMTLCDFDRVEESNLHRQIIHDTKSLGENKAISAMNRVKALNPLVIVSVVTEKMDENNLSNLVGSADLVVDCTDNYESRFLINDACVLGNKPLVSGAAVGMEGQITVFLPSKGCYRCLHPDPSRIQSCQGCSDAGVLGPVPGIIGSLQAVEVIKLLMIQKCVKTDLSSSSSHSFEILNGKQLLYNAFSGEFFTFDLPDKNPSCILCSVEGSNISSSRKIRNLKESRESLATTRSPEGECKLDSMNESNVSMTHYYKEVLEKSKPHILLDVRSEEQFSMISLSSSACVKKMSDKVCLLNVPLAKLKGGKSAKARQQEAQKEEANIQKAVSELETKYPGEQICTYVLCRRGINSIAATQYLHEEGKIQNVYNLDGGLQKWQIEVDKLFPCY